MILKKTADEYVVHTTTCGDVTEVLTASDYRGVNMEIQPHEPSAGGECCILSRASLVPTSTDLRAEDGAIA